MTTAERIYKSVGPENAFGNSKIIETIKATCKACKGTGKHCCDCSYCETEKCEECDGTGEAI